MADREALDENAQTILDELASIDDHPLEGKTLSYDPIATQPDARVYDPATQVLFESDELDALLTECGIDP